MTDRFRGMPVTAEVDSLEAKVRGDQNLMAAGQGEHGAVVPNPGRDPGRAGGLAANPGDQGFFGEGQGSNIA
jgi:hypothetical protein